MPATGPFSATVIYIMVPLGVHLTHATAVRFGEVFEIKNNNIRSALGLCDIFTVRFGAFKNNNQSCGAVQLGFHTPSQVVFSGAGWSVNMSYGVVGSGSPLNVFFYRVCFTQDKGHRIARTFPFMFHMDIAYILAVS